MEKYGWSEAIPTLIVLAGALWNRFGAKKDSSEVGTKVDNKGNELRSLIDEQAKEIQSLKDSDARIMIQLGDIERKQAGHAQNVHEKFEEIRSSLVEGACTLKELVATKRPMTDAGTKVPGGNT